MNKIHGNTQGKKTKEKLILAAIECLAKEGIHRISFQSIAKESKIDQPLVVYHFKTKENIFPEVWAYIYEIALQRTELMLNISGNAEERLLNYMRVSIEIFAESRNISLVYFQLHFLSAFDAQMRQINTQIKRKAVNRVASIIMEGQKKSEFLQSLDPYLTAKVIHSGLVGILINSITEFEDFSLAEVLKSFETRILESILL